MYPINNYKVDQYTQHTYPEWQEKKSKNYR